MASIITKTLEAAKKAQEAQKAAEEQQGTAQAPLSSGGAMPVTSSAPVTPGGPLAVDVPVTPGGAVDAPGAELEGAKPTQAPDFAGIMAEFQEQLANSDKAYKDAFSQIQASIEGQGQQMNAFVEQLSKAQEEMKGQVDIASPEFQQQLQQALEDGETDFTDIIKQFGPGSQSKVGELAFDDSSPLVQRAASKPETWKGEELTLDGMLFKKKGGQSSELFNEAGQSLASYLAGKKEEPPPDIGGGKDVITNDVSTTDQAKMALDNISGMDGMSALGLLTAAGYDINSLSSAEMLQAVMLQQSLNSINDPLVDEYLTRAADRARESLDSALSIYGDGGTAISEIDKAMSGADFVPTTFEGLSAKILADSKEQGLESIELEKSYIKEQQRIWMEQESDKRGRLEGYLKAKMYAAGAQDSLAGLSVMALTINAADLRIQLQNNEFNYGISKLNVEGRKIMTDFTNKILEVNLTAESKKSTALESFNDEMFKIEGLIIENEKEKRKLSLDAISKFGDRMYKIDQDKKKEEQFWYKQNYAEARDLVDDAYKLSGMMGTLYYVDENGNTVDSGIPTFNSQKWEDTKWQKEREFSWKKKNDMWDWAIDAVDRGVSGQVLADVLGIPELATAKSKEEYKAIINQQYDSGLTVEEFAAVVDSNAFKSLEEWTGKGIQNAGIPGIDPLSFTDVKEAFDEMKGVEFKQGYGFDTPVDYIAGTSTHQAYDVVWKDGFVKSFTGGTVTQIIPDPNPSQNKGWGLRMIITDDFGRMWQYGHLDNGGDLLEVGTRVQKGAVIAEMGNSGFAMPATFKHTHWSLVGYDPTYQNAPGGQGSGSGYTFNKADFEGSYVPSYLLDLLEGTTYSGDGDVDEVGADSFLPGGSDELVI